MLRRENGGAEHIKKSMHFCFHFIAKLSDGMMETCGELNRELMRRRRHKCRGDLPGAWKRICRHSAGAQFVTERCRLRIGVVFGQQRNGLLRSFRRRFPKTGKSPRMTLASSSNAESASFGKNISR